MHRVHPLEHVSFIYWKEKNLVTNQENTNNVNTKQTVYLSLRRVKIHVNFFEKAIIIKRSFAFIRKLSSSNIRTITRMKTNKRSILIDEITIPGYRTYVE